MAGLEEQNFEIKRVEVGEEFSFDETLTEPDAGIFVSAVHRVMGGFYAAYSLGLSGKVEIGGTGQNELKGPHIHSWNSVANDNKLYMFCSNTEGNCDYQGTSTDLDNAFTLTMDLSEDELEYGENPYDIVNIYDKDKNTVDLEDEFIETMGLKFTFVGRDGTAYDENETAPTKVGKYTINLYSACDNTQKISADFEIVAPKYLGDADKVVLFEDTDFEYVFYKDGSYTSNVSGDESGTVEEAVTFFNATENNLSFDIFSELYPGDFSMEVPPEAIPDLLELLDVPYGVGIRCRYVAAEKKMSLIPITHLHKWNISADGSTLTAECICDNTIDGYEGCDYKDKSGNDRKIVITIEAQNYEYGDSFVDIAKDATGAEYDPYVLDEICKQLRLNVSYKGRGNTIYAETDTLPERPGKYTYSIYSEDASDVKATSDFEIVVPEHPDGYKVVVCSDEDFDYIFYKDGSYTSDVVGDESGTITNQLAFFGAAGDSIHFTPEALGGVADGSFSSATYAPADIPMLLSFLGIENGVGIECKYIAAEKMVYVNPLVHEHLWEFSADGTTLTAVCKCDESTACYNVCDFKDKTLEERTFKIKLSGEEKMEFSGDDYEVSLLDDSSEEISKKVFDLLGLKVRYIGRENTEYDEVTAPYQTGKYTAKLYSSKAPEKAVSMDFEITLTDPSGAGKLLQGGTGDWAYKFYKDGKYISDVVGDESGTLTADAVIINVLKNTMNVSVGSSLDCAETMKLNVTDILHSLNKEDALGIECFYEYDKDGSYFKIVPIEHEHIREYSITDSQNGQMLKVTFNCVDICDYYDSYYELLLNVNPEVAYGSFGYDDISVKDNDYKNEHLSELWEYGLKLTFTGTGDTVYSESSVLPKKLGTYVAKLYPISETTPEHVISSEFSIVLPEGETGYKFISCVDTDVEYNFFIDGTYTSNVSGDESGKLGEDYIKVFNASGSILTEEGIGLLGEIEDGQGDGDFNIETVTIVAQILGGTDGVGMKFEYDASEKTFKLSAIVHNHEWDYTADDTSIVAKCVCDDTTEGYPGCEFKGKTEDERKASMNISITSDTFTESLPDDAVTVSAWSSELKGLGKASAVYYVSQDKVTYTETKTKPTDVGKYYAKVYLLDQNDKNIKDSNGKEVFAQVAFNIVKEVTVSFAGGSGATGSVDSKKGNSFDKITLPENGFKKAGYTFDGWTDGVNTYKAGVEYTIPASDITLKAKWKQDTYSVSFSGGKDVTGNAPLTIKAHYNEKIALPKNTFTKKGYKFAGWTDGTNVYKEGVNYTVKKTVTLTAKWDKLPQYTISFAGGSGATGTAPKSIKGYEKDSIKLPKNTFTKNGYKFEGWSDGKKTYKEGAKYAIPAKNVKFTAVWKQTDPTLTFIERCYKVALGRDSDPEGLKYWQDKLDNYKYCGAQVGYGFIFSDEYKATNTSDEQFIKDLYKMFFDREPDQAGYDYWIGQMKNKTSREEVFAGFANSDEFFDLCSTSNIARGIYVPGYDLEKQGGINGFVARLYKVCLGRLPEKDGHAYWVNKLISGEKTGTDVSREFILSDEFMGLNLSDEEFVGKLYAAFFGREGDPDGIKYWLGELKNNKSREEVFNGFATSSEFKKLCKSFGIQP